MVRIVNIPEYRLSVHVDQSDPRTDEDIRLKYCLYYRSLENKKASRLDTFLNEFNKMQYTSNNH